MRCFIPLLPLVTCIACISPELSTDIDSLGYSAKKFSSSEKGERITTTPSTKDTSFQVTTHNTILPATITESGTVTILEYPSEWRGKGKVVRFIGETVYEPFSLKYCESIRRMASYPKMGGMIRSMHHFFVALEIPLFLSNTFHSTIVEDAKSAGVSLDYYYLSNPVDFINGQIDLSFGENSISSKIGFASELTEQLHLTWKGNENSPQEKKLIVSAADLICDLISGDATFSMVYKVKDSEQVIRVTYDPLEVKLEETKENVDGGSG